jgi:hypothetical protein
MPLYHRAHGDPRMQHLRGRGDRHHSHRFRIRRQAPDGLRLRLAG